MGKKRTHLPADALMISRLHANWRLQAIENLSKIESQDLALSSPMSIRAEDYPQIRRILIAAIEQIINIAAKTEEPDMLTCMNVDLFRF